MTPRDRRRVQPDLDIGIASDDVFSDGQREALPAPLEPAQGSDAVWLQRSSATWWRHRRTRSRIRAPFARKEGFEPRSPSASRISATRFERFASATNVSGQRRCCSTSFDRTFGRSRIERSQQLERLRRQVNVAASARQLSRVEIEDEWAEAERHGSCLEKTCGFPGNPLRLARAWSLS